ncbi:hypothetical protein B0H14DRAFT_377215 [Mycena olivaceomarginata]|nr:hypothetical protein B0H14DRAFT_377215 [Mycena olivaceomarginata]
MDLALLHSHAAHALLRWGYFFLFACEHPLACVTLAPQSKVTHKIASFVRGSGQRPRSDGLMRNGSHIKWRHVHLYLFIIGVGASAD